MDMIEKIKDVILNDDRVNNAIGMVDDDVRILQKSGEYIESEIRQIVTLVDKLSNSKIYLPEEANSLAGKIFSFKKLYNECGAFGKIIERNCNLDLFKSELANWKANSNNHSSYDKEDVNMAILHLGAMVEDYVNKQIIMADYIARGARADGGYKTAITAINKAERQIDYNYKLGKDVNSYEIMRNVFNSTKLPNGRMLYEYYLGNKKHNKKSMTQPAGSQMGE